MRYKQYTFPEMKMHSLSYIARKDTRDNLCMCSLGTLLWHTVQ